MKKKSKDHPIWFVFKLAVFLLFVVVPVVAWQTGQNFWTRLHEKRVR